MGYKDSHGGERENAKPVTIKTAQHNLKSNGNRPWWEWVISVHISHSQLNSPVNMFWHILDNLLQSQTICIFFYLNQRGSPPSYISFFHMLLAFLPKFAVQIYWALRRQKDLYWSFLWEPFQLTPALGKFFPLPAASAAAVLARNVEGDYSLLWAHCTGIEDPTQGHPCIGLPD